MADIKSSVHGHPADLTVKRGEFVVEHKVRGPDPLNPEPLEIWISFLDSPEKPPVVSFVEKFEYVKYVKEG